MTGYIKISREQGRTFGCVKQVCGLSLVVLTICAPQGLKARMLERRLSKAERILHRAAVHRVIFPPEFPYREHFRAFKAVEPLDFYRSVADVLVLGWFECRGADARQGRVALTGARLSPDMEYAARRLCPAVRGICIDVPDQEGDLFAAELQQIYGVPVIPKGTSTDLTVEFSPVGKGQLRLWGEKPFLDGLKLIAETVEPPVEIADSVVALLWEQGRIRRGQLRVICENKCGEN